MDLEANKTTIDVTEQLSGSSTTHRHQWLAFICRIRREKLTIDELASVQTEGQLEEAPVPQEGNILRAEYPTLSLHEQTQEDSSHDAIVDQREINE